MTLEWSHGRRRPSTRTAAGDVPALPTTPPETVQNGPVRDPLTGRFLKGNGAARRRSLRAAAKGIHTLNPAACPSWIAPFARLGAAYALELAATLPAHPALGALVGDAADARAVFRGLLALAAQGDTEALKEARAWLREHRALVATIAALATELREDIDGKRDPSAELRAALERERREVAQ